MSIYSTTDVYPGDVDTSMCEQCGFDCDVYEYCKQTAIKDYDLQDQYLYDVLEQKGYGGCKLKVEKIHGKSWLVLYPFSNAYVIAEKCNMELCCPVVPLKTKYTMGVPGLNVSNCYTQLLEVIDQLSDIDLPISYDKVVSVDDMYEYCRTQYPDTFQHCLELNIQDKAEVINLVDALNHLGLRIVTSAGEITGYIPPEEELVL
ncbi:MAG: hypothetical protein ACI389_02430 [Methanobrevibacter sp.]|uniref:hypothetical protein n=1 Tax=Methanobrevibacter sp. TaxID=66852 RepID=UPI003EFF9E24